MTVRTPAERDLLRAAIDRMVPPDRDPGATDLGADRYILRQLASDAEKDAGPVFAGLQGLDDAARERFRSPFAALDAARQDELMQDASSSPWFAVLAELTAEGVYADPGNGGNADARSWAMIGYEHRLPEGPSGPAGEAPEHAERPNRDRATADARGG